VPTYAVIISTLHYMVINVFKEKTSITVQELNAIEKIYCYLYPYMYRCQGLKAKKLK